MIFPPAPGKIMENHGTRWENHGKSTSTPMIFPPSMATSWMFHVFMFSMKPEATCIVSFQHMSSSAMPSMVHFLAPFSARPWHVGGLPTVALKPIAIALVQPLGSARRRKMAVFTVKFQPNKLGDDQMGPNFTMLIYQSRLNWNYTSK